MTEGMKSFSRCGRTCDLRAGHLRSGASARHICKSEVKVDTPERAGSHVQYLVFNKFAFHLVALDFG